jgi:hypothetical protein
MLRNLFYNCCPHVDAEEVWMDNIRWLLKYRDAFNNKLLVNIKTGENMVDPEFVKSRFNGMGGDVEFCLVPNDPEVHELAGFLEGLDSLRSERDDEITFYAHTKGVYRAVIGWREFEQVSIRQWRNRMYHECLSDSKKVEEVFLNKPKNPHGFYAFSNRKTDREAAAAGCFLCWGKFGLHFAGTYYWLRHSTLFARDWKKIPDSRYGPEEYISVQFKPSELRCLRELRNRNRPTFYHEVSAVYKCPNCGVFEARVEDKVKCPKCKKQTSYLEKINDMGF